MPHSIFKTLNSLGQAIAKSKLKIVLGSSSPRRQEALTFILGSRDLFVIEASNFAEDLPHQHYKTAIDYSMATAMEKSKELARRYTNSSIKTLIVTADTVVAINNKILEKPQSSEDAMRMLRMLSGQTHEVHTSVIVREMPENSLAFSFTSTTKVHFAELSEQDMLDYIATGEPLDKAGAYAIQGLGRFLVSSITGDFFNSVGFPARDFALKLGAWFTTYLAD